MSILAAIDNINDKDHLLSIFCQKLDQNDQKASYNSSEIKDAFIAIIKSAEFKQDINLLIEKRFLKNKNQQLPIQQI